jgi:hypothetical protein
VTLRIELVNNSETERSTHAQLLSLLDRYDVSSCEYTDHVRIEDGVIPHSHPVLTLSTRAPHDMALLSTYLHEQLHWFSIRCDSPEADAELCRRYPDQDRSTYIHYHVCWLELDALARLFPRDDVKAYLLRKPYYEHIYATVVADDDALRALFAAHGMVAE